MNKIHKKQTGFLAKSEQMLFIYYLCSVCNCLKLDSSCFCCYLMQVRELLVPDKGLLAGKLSPTQQTSQFNPVCHSPLLLIFLTPFFFTVSFSAVGRDQTLLLRRWTLKMKDTRSGDDRQPDIEMVVLCLRKINKRIGCMKNYGKKNRLEKIHNK